VLGALLLVSAGAHAACPFNVSGVGTLTDPASFDLLRDGVLITRYAQGMRGAALVAGTGTTAATVESNITSNLAQLDINGDGFLDVQDALVINRALLGIANSKQAAGTANVNYGTRTNAAVMQAFVAGGCNITFAAPTTDQVDAARFLIQSTFGPSLDDIQSFVALTPDAAVSGSNHKKQRATWLNNQLNMARGQKHFDYLLARKVEYDAAGQTFYSEMSREAFWGQALKSPDQLRQRLAFALSEVLVVSENGGSNDPFELAAYLDLLADNGFGNFRDILNKVALSPAMGRYLSHLRNDGGSANPNENFAREILQLFAVGLFMLNPDGTATATASYDENTVKGFAKVFTGFSYDDPYCKVGDPGYAIARNNCADGYATTHPTWSWDPTDDPPANAGGETFPPVLAGWGRSMVAFPGKHSALSKQLLKYNYASPVAACTAAVNIAKPVASGGSDGLLPAITTTGSGVTTGTRVNVTQANATLTAAIDNVFCHPNVGPFISRHLIKFLVTSTPTPAYVQRVATVFNDNGSGIRGDMKAVLRAILLDDEAVSPATTLTATEYAKFGKLKEPMLRLSAILRAFNGTASSGRYIVDYINGVEDGISQGPLQSPTVFNYFHPDFSPPGPVSTNNAIAPEFQITTTTAVAATQNMFGRIATDSNGNVLYTQNGMGNFYYPGTCDSTNTKDCIFSNLSDLYAIQASSANLLDYINLVLLGGTLSQTNKDNLATALETAYPVYNLPASPTAANITTWQDRKRNRVKSALWLAVHTPEFQIQR